MSDFLLVLLIALFASFLTYLGAPIAERFAVSQKVVSAVLQFHGIITALVAFTLMPPAVRGGSYGWIILAFFIGGVLWLLEYTSTRALSGGPTAEKGATSFGLYIGVLADLLIDGMVIGIGSTLTLKTGLLLALGLAIGARAVGLCDHFGGQAAGHVAKEPSPALPVVYRGNDRRQAWWAIWC